MKINTQQTEGNGWISSFYSFYFCLLVVLPLFSSCLFQKGNSVSARTVKKQNGRISNDPNTVSAGYGRILRSNPIILSGNSNLADGFDFGKLLSLEQDFITYNSILESGCGPINLTSARKEECFQVLSNALSTNLTSINGKWAFDP